MLENIKPYYLAEQEANDKQKLLLLTPVLLTFNNDSSQNKNKKPTTQPTNSIWSYSALSKKEEPPNSDKMYFGVCVVKQSLFI